MLSSLSRLATSATVVTATVIGTVLPGVPAAAASSGRWIVTGPSRALSAQVSLDPQDGSLTLGVTKAGRTVLAPAALGLRTTGADLTRGLRLVDRAERTVTEDYSMTTGKRRDRATQMSELRLEFRGDNDARLDLVVRVAPDGVAYRYETPVEVTVTGEASAFTLPAGAPAWLLPYDP